MTEKHQISITNKIHVYKDTPPSYALQFGLMKRKRSFGDHAWTQIKKAELQVGILTRDGATIYSGRRSFRKAWRERPEGATIVFLTKGAVLKIDGSYRPQDRIYGRVGLQNTMLRPENK